MNEVKHIHIGRQQFTVSAEAYSELKHYLEAIKKSAGNSGADVAEEVELRMAELLKQRGITSEKVIVLKDVEFLKAQLGEPSDFSDDDETPAADRPEGETSRRLFRDTDNAMVAGVASGLAHYFDIDPVIVRIIFIALVFFGGSGALIYILLWLLVPEAQTTSERLSMEGKAATVDNLKQLVERADVPGAARRSRSAVARVLGVVGTIILFVVGLPLIIGASLGLLWTIAVSIYLLMNGLKLGGQVIAPVGSHEVIGFIAVVITLLSVLFMMLLIGVAMVRRRWQVPAWGVAALAGVFFVAASIGGALAADVVPAIRHKVQSLQHTQTVQLSPFTAAAVTGNDLNIEYVPDSKSFVQYRYYGDVDVSKLRTTVANGKLQIATGTAAEGDCDSFCTDIRPGVEVDIHSPKLTDLNINGRSFSADSAGPDQPVFFGWHPKLPQRGTVEYGVPDFP